MNLFQEDNIVHIFFNQLGDIIVANLLFVLFSLPIITIGPALCALYFCMLKSIHHEGGQITKLFLKSFRANFFPALKIWMILLMTLFILIVNLAFLTKKASLAGVLFLYGTYGMCFLWFLLFLYIFPVLAAFDNKLSMLISHAFLFSVKHLPISILLILIHIIPIYFSYVDLALRPLYAFCWFFFGFGLLAYISSFFFRKMFQPYLS